MSPSPKMTAFEYASRKVCHTSIELATFGTSTTRPAWSPNTSYAGFAAKKSG